MDKKEIGRRISVTRKQLGMTQKDLAEKLHVTDKFVSKWETGTHFPDIAIMENLAAALKFSTVELLGLEQASSEEMISEMALISMEEKQSIVREIINRGWLTAIIGLMSLQESSTPQGCWQITACLVCRRYLPQECPVLLA